VPACCKTKKQCCSILWRVQVLFSDNNASGNTRGMLPKDRAVTEAAVCQSVSHRNVVSTYHYDIKPVQTMEQSSGVVLDMGDSDVENVTEWRLYLVQEWWVQGCTSQDTWCCVNTCGISYFICHHHARTRERHQIALTSTPLFRTQHYSEKRCHRLAFPMNLCSRACTRGPC
jgi:hypothetical protein